MARPVDKPFKYQTYQQYSEGMEVMTPRQLSYMKYLNIKITKQVAEQERKMRDES